MNKQDKIRKTVTILLAAHQLMESIESERDESINNPRFDGEEELLEQYYKKILSSIYRMRNNSAALLLWNHCGCAISEDNKRIKLNIDGFIYEFTIPTIKNILQSDFERILEKNKAEEAPLISISYSPESDLKQQETAVKKQVETMLEEKELFTDQSFDKKKETNISQHSEFYEDDVKEKTPVLRNLSDKPSDSEQNKVVESKPDSDDRMFLWEETELVPPVLGDESTDFEIGLLFDDDDDVPDTIEEAKKPDSLDNQNEQSDLITGGTEFNHDNSLEFEGSNRFPLYEDTIVQGNAAALIVEKESILSQNTPADAECDCVFETELENDVLCGDVKNKTKTDNKADDTPAESKASENNKFRIKPIKSKKLADKNEIDKKSLHFVTEVTNLDTEAMLEQLYKSKDERERNELQKKLLESISLPSASSSTIFDISTGKKVAGQVDATEAANKIENLVGGIIHASKKDIILDERAKHGYDAKSHKEGYGLQKESDYTRRGEEFLMDEYHLSLSVEDNQGELRKDDARLLVIPMFVPESGSALVTDIAIFWECNGQCYSKAVKPGGDSTIALKSEDYAIFIRGSWDCGEFLSSVSIVGVKDYQAEKNPIRPASIKSCGIGHNILYVDHVTTVHILPRHFKNNLYDGDYVDMVAIIIRDYGISLDYEEIYTDASCELRIDGERYKYGLIGKWQDDVFTLKMSMVK